jgi:acetolactate synthase-1/2/3 large subunit
MPGKDASLATMTDAAQTKVVPESVAEAFLLQLRARGMEHFFVNAGTDFAPLVEAYARLDDHPDAQTPQPVLAGHESAVMGMAHGAYLMTGQPQPVMFHVNVGTANAVCGVLNAAAEHVPLLVCAGRSPIFEAGRLGARNTRVAWGQEMFDQAAMVRESVKWEYELRGGAQLEGVVDRALTIAMTAPRGPVYLTLPREVIAEASDGGPSRSPTVAIPTAPFPDPAAVGRLADQLAKARFPVISAMASGADPRSVRLLADLCERYGIGYAEEQARYLNFPSNHPLHLGYALGPVLREADALCFVEADVPWVPEFGGSPKLETFVAQCGEDPSFERYPIRTHRSDLAITTGAAVLFAALGEALEARRAMIDPQRRDRLAAWATSVRRSADEAAKKSLQGDGPITNVFVGATLAKCLNNRCTVFNEYSLSRSFLDLNEPRSYFFLPATGGLGWAMPAALGAKLKAPERTMIAVVGDGTYVFSNPAACHHASQKHHLPTLTIVLNNSRWGAVDGTARMAYPKGHLTKKTWHAISDLRPAPAFEHYAIASGGFGRRVSQRGELEGALLAAFEAVQVQGQQALLNVICE